MSLLLVLFISLLSLGSATSSPNDHLYNAGDRVPLFVNKVGPLHNPSETYQFYDLPFCHPDPIIQKKESLGEVLNGDCLANALYDLQFWKDKTDEILCEKNLQGHEVAKFRDAVSNDFYFQMYYDDLPLWGFIGKVEEQSWITEEKVHKYYLFTHIQFDVLYNGNQVIEINAFSDPNHAVDITQDIEINVKFSYSVIWNATSTQFQSRMDKYSRASLLPIHQQVHWLSFINSIVIVVLLTGLLTVLFMRRLKNDLRKCSSGEEEEIGEKEVGWKYIHGDVFRHPQNISLFCAFLGTGTQILTL
ncbi:transmembrane 9 superfamily member 5 isoform X2 [Tripterygium wilfordii]|uniref:Transmembrane 9 superfamily member n=2 Tax=Tripterygium wilfordii TaxID=458696 RepID=A0A7J7DZI4_TRIWF|nr:transmembrane 9 superfamily member 5 isoform X2 [Tripterygium wilfordii]